MTNQEKKNLIEQVEKMLADADIPFMLVAKDATDDTWACCLAANHGIPEKDIPYEDLTDEQAIDAAKAVYENAVALAGAGLSSTVHHMSDMLMDMSDIQKEQAKLTVCTHTMQYLEEEHGIRAAFIPASIGEVLDQMIEDGNPHLPKPPVS